MGNAIYYIEFEGVRDGITHCIHPHKKDSFESTHQNIQEITKDDYDKLMIEYKKGYKWLPFFEYKMRKEMEWQ